MCLHITWEILLICRFWISRPGSLGLADSDFSISNKPMRPGPSYTERWDFRLEHTEPQPWLHVEVTWTGFLKTPNAHIAPPEILIWLPDNHWVSNFLTYQHFLIYLRRECCILKGPWLHSLKVENKTMGEDVILEDTPRSESVPVPDHL